MQNPFILVIFGATGDLTKNKLIPSFFSLFKMGQMPEKFYIIGFSRRDLSNEEFIQIFEEYAKDPSWKSFAKHLMYHRGEFQEEDAYNRLSKELINLNKKDNIQFSRIYYLATPPQNYTVILDLLNKFKKQLSQGFLLNDRIAKIAIEKPFGKDLETAKHLDQKIYEYFKEWQVFRVDHYLGKETVQNILVFRFANSIFEPIWNNEYIDHVQITMAEEKGIANRGKFFDGVGILRDVGQNHILQLLAAVAMEMPKSFSKEGVRDARFGAISALKCFNPKEVETHVVRGQYTEYTKEKDVDSLSQTETFVAIKAFLNNNRFAGVPFYIRAGKKLAKNLVTVSIVFRQTCHLLFKEVGCPEEGNVLTFRIQPNEGISIHTIVKEPGAKLMLGNVDIKFNYHETFGTHGQEAYQKILVDILTGDQMLFNRSDELKSSWEFITNILKGWEKSEEKVLSYKSGSWGPKEAKELIEKDGRRWIE